LFDAAHAISRRRWRTILVGPNEVISMETPRQGDSQTREAFGVREFCARYSICRETFYEEVRRGRIQARKLGKKTVILRADAEKWASSLPALNLAVTA
jgi:helix-turn-helix protein